MSKKAVLYRMLTDDHVCPYGIKSKDLLKRKGYKVEDHKLKSREETDKFKEEHGVETTPQTFIDEQRIGGYDDLRKFFGMESKQDQSGTTYQPVIAVFSLAFFMAIATSISMASFSVIRTIELFIAISMCILAILKLRDLFAFSNQFITYDLLARRFVRYAYIYPFAEAIAGVGMIAKVAIPIVAPLALFIGTVGSISVIKAVYIDNRELKCACVGGNSNVPLGFISLTENVMMVVMGIWMLVSA